MSEEKSYSIKDIEIERGHAQAEKELRLEAEKRLKAFEGIDPADYAKTKAERDELKNKAAAGSEEAVTARVKEAVEAERVRLEKALADERQAKDALAKDLKTERATKAILQKASGAFGSDTLELLTPIFDRDSDYEDGQVIFKDAKGNKRYSPKDATKPLSVEEYVEEMRNKYPTAATATAGIGGKTDAKKINGVNGIKINSLKDLESTPDKGKAYLAQLGKEDPAALRALMSK